MPSIHKLLADTLRTETVFELGSRFGLDTIELAKEMPWAEIHAFEANPERYDELHRRANKFNGQIKVVERAVWEEDGEVSFRINRTENVGASSVFADSGKYKYEKYRLDEPIKVPCTRLDTYIEQIGKAPGIIWSDLQGADLAAMKSLGKYIDDVMVVYMEINCIEMYEGIPTFVEIYEWMFEHNFRLHRYKSLWHGDFGEGLFIKMPS